MNILIIGHYGGKNFGDEAMLYALLSKLIEKDETQIKVVSKDRKYFYFKNKGVDYIPPSIFNVIKAIFKADTLILGGGTHFHDGYNSKRLKKHYSYLFKILFLYGLLFLQNKKIYQLGVGYGPFRGKLIEVLASLSIYFSTRTFLRDTQSYNWLKETGISLSNTEISFDLVGLDPALNAENKSEKKDIGISVTSLAFNEFNVGDEFWSHSFFPEVEKIFKNTDANFKIFVFRGGGKESDNPLSKQLYQKMKEIDKNRVTIINFTEDVSSYIEEVKSCRKFFASRFHSALLAYLCKCELFVIPYHQKLISLANDIGLSKDALYNFCESSDVLSDRMNRFALDDTDKYLASMPIEEAIQKSQKNISSFL